MATLRITTAAVPPNTPSFDDAAATAGFTTARANKRRIFVFSGNLVQGLPSVGNVPRTIPRIGQYAYGLNNPSVIASISVSAAGPAFFDSTSLTQQPTLVNELSIGIEKGYVVVVDTAAPGVPLTRAALQAFL